MADKIFELNDVGYSYNGGITALRNVNLSIECGEQIAVLGANGSGKSTLLKILDGLIFPISGEFSAFGQLISEDTLNNNSKFQRYFRERVGFVFQNSDVQLFSPTVYEEIAFGPMQLGLSENEVHMRVDDTMDMMRITALKDRFPYTLSGGEKRKVAIASVLSINPDVLLLDEPTDSLDPRTKTWLVEFLNELHALGKTIIIATHDLEIAKKIARRGVVLSEEHGIAADNNIDEIISNRELLNEVNLIHEHTHKHGEKIHIHKHAHFKGHEHVH